MSYQVLTYASKEDFERGLNAMDDKGYLLDSWQEIGVNEWQFVAVFKFSGGAR